jgi:uncharacterized membrane protein (UPF0127 family)
MIKNVSKNKLLAKKSVIRNSAISKAKGLMFSKKIKDKGLIFIFKKEKRHSLHMLFVFFPIDVLWLNKDRKVVDMKKNFMPFSLIAKPKQKASYIIELPQGTIKSTKTKIKDIIKF